MVTYSKECIDDARKNGLHLVKIELNGRHARRTLIGACKEACAHPGAVLFDDSPENCKKFVTAGGQACLVPRPWNFRHRECDHDTGKIADVQSALAAYKWER